MTTQLLGKLEIAELFVIGLRSDAVRALAPRKRGAQTIRAVQQALADGKATKISIPSEMQGMVGLAKGVVESVKE